MPSNHMACLLIHGLITHLYLFPGPLPWVLSPSVTYLFSSSYLLPQFLESSLTPFNLSQPTLTCQKFSSFQNPFSCHHFYQFLPPLNQRHGTWISATVSVAETQHFSPQCIKYCLGKQDILPTLLRDRTAEFSSLTYHSCSLCHCLSLLVPPSTISTTIFIFLLPLMWIIPFSEEHIKAISQGPCQNV